MIFIDTETCGLHGVPVLIQYAEDDGEITLHEIWSKPICQTLELIEHFCNHDGGLVFFNAVFDWFHLCKIYTMFRLYYNSDQIPYRAVDDIADLELLARDGPCLKPKAVHDVFLHARKTEYQSLMDRHDIRIRRVPTAIAWQLASELERRIILKDVYFARKKKITKKWNVYDIKDSEDNTDPDFKDVVLKFSASSALKALAIDALKLPAVIVFNDVSVDDAFLPVEYGYAPFAKAAGGDRTNWQGAWPEYVLHHDTHWSLHTVARQYAEDDIKYTRGLYKYFGSPLVNDDDSVLACSVAACRWRGYAVDIPKLKSLKQSALLKIAKIPTAPGPVRHYVTEYMDETERLGLRGSTKKTILQTVSKLLIPCPDCNYDAKMQLVVQDVHPDLIEDHDAVVKTEIRGGDKKCVKCKGTGSIRHKAAIRAEEVLNARTEQKRIEIYDKLIMAGRFHVSMKVIGTLSGRMAGSDDLNPQGIPKTKEVRSCFPLTTAPEVLCGGDLVGFEVTLAEAAYKDPKLRKTLLTCEDCDGELEFDQIKKDFICKSCGGSNGKSIHSLFGMLVYPGMSYEDVKNTKGTEDDKYTKAKSALFAMLYGGQGFTLQERLGVDLEDANKAYEAFGKEYPGVAIARQRIISKFQSMKQPGGIGTQVIWEDPEDYISSMLGFRRYFIIENRICKALFTLANDPPKEWRDVKIKVNRRDRIQTAGGATQSALYAAAFNLQASNMRAAANHEIQSTGAQITKATQRAIWDLQPAGIHDWLVQPTNIHDEIQCPCKPEISDKVKEVVYNTVESYRDIVPLIKIDWSTNLKTWADK